MVVPKAVPILALDVRPSQLLGHDELDLGKRCVRVRIVVDLADDLRIGRNDFAVVMI
jgi:hypothetical protein